MVHIVLAAALIGCTSSGGYRSVADQLTGIEMIQPWFGISAKWVPLSEGPLYESSEQELNASRVALLSCVDALTEEFDFQPSEVLRSAQVVRCMRDQGWDIAFEEVLRTN